MYVASLSIIILTLFGFWFSALGFGVYGLYVFNHNQVSGATVEPLNNKFGTGQVNRTIVKCHSCALQWTSFVNASSFARF